MKRKSKFNPYEELDIPKDATEQEIKAARKRRVKKAHPDVGGTPEEFNRVQKAALILLNPQRRRKYDKDGTIDDEGPIDQMRAQALEMVFSYVARAIDEYVGKDMKGYDPRKRRLLFEYCHQASQKVIEIENQIKIGERIEKYYLDMATRFTSEKDKNNLLRQQMENCAHNTLLKIDELKQQIAKIKMSIEICEMYDFRFDPAEYVVQGNFYSTTTTG